MNGTIAMFEKGADLPFNSHSVQKDFNSSAGDDYTKNRYLMRICKFQPPDGPLKTRGDALKTFNCVWFHDTSK